MLDGSSEEERERTAAACCYFTTRRTGNPSTTSALRCLPFARIYHGTNSLSRPHAVTTPRSPLSSTLSFSLIRQPVVLLSLALCLLLTHAARFHPSPPPFRSRRSCETPVHHHRCRRRRRRRRCYPLPPGFQQPTPLDPLALYQAPSRARYQPAAIPTATTESRDRPRVVGSPPVSHPTRRHATPRRALRVFLRRVLKACEREKPYCALPLVL